MAAGKRDRAPPLMRRKAACRLNAHRSCLMTDGMTTVEGLKLAAQGFERDLAKLSCCAG